MSVNHVGIILDGNRRYAEKIGKKRFEGHKFGLETVRSLIEEWALELGIKELTLYTFSMQNFKRSKIEIDVLFRLFEDYFTNLKNELVEKGIRVRFIGRVHAFPSSIQNIVKELEDATKDCKRLNVNFAFGYGGREEVIDGIKKLVKEVQAEKLSLEDINEEMFGKYLYLQSEPDLIIRTGGAVRTSNFLIWQSWYSEWFFPEKFWPEFTKEDLRSILDEFEQRQRRFGK